MNTAAEASHLGPSANPVDSSPLTAAVGRLSDDLKLLARQEGELLKRELSESFAEAKRHAAYLALGVGALTAGVLLLLAAAVLALATVVAAWSAALLVGGAVSLLGLVLMLSGKAKLSRLDFKPQRAVESLEKDLTAIKQAVR